MVKLVDMREALQQVREKAPNTADAMKRFKSGNAGFTDKAHLKAKGLIPRADGTKKVSPKYESDAYDNERYEIRNGKAYRDVGSTPDKKNHVYVVRNRGEEICYFDSRKSDMSTGTNGRNITGKWVKTNCK